MTSGVTVAAIIAFVRSLNTDDLSYHILSGNTYCTVINYQDSGRNRPNRLNVLSPSKVFHSHFGGDR